MKRIVLTLRLVVHPVVLFTFLFALNEGAAMAQKVSNVTFRQDGQLVHIYYDLSAKADVSVELSTDGGKNFGTIRMVHVGGDVGKGVSAGSGKRITWTVLQDCDRLQGDRICFRVTAQVTAGTKRIITVNDVKFTMVYVAGGTFLMGKQNSNSCSSNYDREAFDDESPVHSVTLSGYYMGETEVTQALWKEVMGSNPSFFKGDELPVETVSWDDVQKFIRKLSAKTGRIFRLPTEAEWEYAARGGNKSRGFRYSGGSNIDEVAWYDNNSGNRTHPVKMQKANEIGLYDMSGNVWEWCSDRYGSYSSDSQTNPEGSFKASNRVDRGGSWFGGAGHCRVSGRDDSEPSGRYNYLGFRLVMCP